MKNLTIIYWSGTGNTKAMAEAVSEGIYSNHDDVDVLLLSVEEATKEMVENADGIALGCPSMGAEVLEESYMEPFVDDISDVVAGKPVVLFGSYDWGSGEWMENWEARMADYGAILVASGLIVNLTPDEEGLDRCRELGSTLVASI